MRTCAERIFIHPNSKLLRILKILQMEVEGLLVVNPSIVDKRVDLPTIAMPTCPKRHRHTLLRRWSDMYNKTDTVKANVGTHSWTIGCTPPNLHNWKPGLTQEWARSYRFARTCVESSTTFARVTDKPHAISVQLSVIPWAMSRLWYRRSCIVSAKVLQYPPLWNIYGPIQTRMDPSSPHLNRAPPQDHC